MLCCFTSSGFLPLTCWRWIFLLQRSPTPGTWVLKEPGQVFQRGPPASCQQQGKYVPSRDFLEVKAQRVGGFLEYITKYGSDINNVCWLHCPVAVRLICAASCINGKFAVRALCVIRVLATHSWALRFDKTTTLQEDMWPTFLKMQSCSRIFWPSHECFQVPGPSAWLFLCSSSCIVLFLLSLAPNWFSPQHGSSLFIEPEIWERALWRQKW